MGRRNRDQNKDREQSTGSTPLLDPLYPRTTPILTVKDPDPESKAKPVQVVPERTEVLERFAAMLPLQDQMPFIVEQRLATNHRTTRRTRAQWQRLYDEYRTRPRY